MGRPENPVDPEAGPVQRFAWQLRQLREQAGTPGYRHLAKRAHYSPSTLADAAKGERLPSLEVALAYAEACGGDPEEWRARWTAASAAPADVEPEGRAEEHCPYQGLTAYQPEHAGWFFGRSRLVDRLTDKVARLPLVGVFGASGSGKSSLLRAGLLGGLSGNDRWRSMLMTPTAHPLEALSGQVAKLSGADVTQLHEELWRDPATLDIAIRTALATEPDEIRALLVVDQFEEVFTLCMDGDERGRFIDALLDVARGPGRRTTVALGVRADFLAHFTQHPGLVDALDDEAQLLVGPMSAADLREVIIRPAILSGIDVDSDLLTTLLADAAAEPGALPLVSHALLETWRHRSGAALGMSAYHATGGVRGAISHTAERVYGELTRDQQQAARLIFLRLSALGDGTDDTRRPIARAELDGLCDEVVIVEVLHRLAEARLIVLDDDRVEVAHEALIRAWPRLHRWLTDDRANLFVHRRLTEAAQSWESLDRDQGALYRGAQLMTARTWAKDHPGELNELESSFLHAGNAWEEAEHDRDRRRARLFQRLVAGMAALLLVAMVSGALAVLQSTEARRQGRAAFAGRLALQARSLLSNDPRLAGLLAIEAYRLSPGEETLGALLSVATARPRVDLNVGGPTAYDIAFSPDHSLLASAHSRGRIALWDPVLGTRIATLEGDAGLARAVAFSADGKLLAGAFVDSKSGSGSVVLWDVPTRSRVTRLAETGLTPAMALSPDGTKVAVGVGKGGIAIHDLSTGIRRVLRAHTSAVTSLAFSPDGEVLASADEVHKPVIWDVATSEKLAAVPAPGARTLAFAQAGRRLTTSGDARGVDLWSLERDRPVRLSTPDLRGSYAWATSTLVGSQVAVADENGEITVWDLHRREPVQVYQDRGRTETTSLALSGDGTILASAGLGGTISLRRVPPPFTGHSSPVNDIKVSPDGRTIASAGADGTVRLWDAQGRPQALLAGHPDVVQAVAFSPDGLLLAAVTRNHTITIWDVRRRKHATALLTYRGQGASTDVAFDPSGRFLAAAGLGTFLWDLDDLAAPVALKVEQPGLIATSQVFSQDGRHVISISPAGFLITTEVATGKRLDGTATGQGGVQDVALSPDGKLIATAGDSRTIKLWDAVTHTEIATLSGHTSAVQALAFSGDSRLIASAGDDHTVMVWDVRARRRVATLTGHTSRVRGLAFTADGALVSGGADSRIIRWTLDPSAAEAHTCQTVGRDLTRQEWSTYLPSLPYRSTCDLAANSQMDRDS
ncbi:helix-turn-helix domain-containing protein [Nonomuraea sp. NPDC050536]|uniref:nSTAND1 domain-containing NTPase n=1 Tax=Nonomuraea sp. NPDC050536 TaxID=3364366 RepID=UPI0037CC93A4